MTIFPEIVESYVFSSSILFIHEYTNGNKKALNSLVCVCVRERGRERSESMECPCVTNPQQTCT
jgi:hypothetical protein